MDAQTAGHSAPAQARSLGAPAWHTLDTDAALQALHASADGLAEDEAKRRLAQHGPNRLPAARRTGPLKRLLLQFHNLLIYVLLASAAVSLLLGHPIDAAVILGVVVVNAIIGFVQEGRAERALDAIRGLIDPQASVLRDGRRRTIPADQVVPGDIAIIEAGDRVPADLRLVRCRNLKIDEAILTGESVPAEKTPAPVAEGAPLGDRRSMAYSGSFVAAGQGLGLVVGTGAATELGRISALIGEVETLTTPLLRQMNRFARQLTIIVIGIVVLVFPFAVYVRGYAATEAFMAMVGLAVASIPEGLPAVMTIALAIGVQRMAARNAIIRRLPAVETLGSVSVICSDKTGTLTRNEMTARVVCCAGRSYDIAGVGYDPFGTIRIGDREIEPDSDPLLSALVRAGLLCNDADLRRTDAGWVIDGDPMEGALVTLAMKAGLDPAGLRKALPRTDEIPFDAQHRFMATLHHSHADGSFILVKGAPERVLEMCDTERHPSGEHPLDRDGWQRAADALAAQGQRVLGFAEKPARAGQHDLAFADVESGLTLLGFVGFIDPPREEAIAAVADCRSAGIRVIMITGDHAVTAREIGHQLGLAEDPHALSGRDLDELGDGALRAAVLDIEVFARTTPEHKLRLVTALQADGRVVAMTGDGVNDAPALKRADIGIAMGKKGTEAAKEAAEMVLADDNFASIVAAVREGRTVYDNLRKTITFLLPINGGESSAILLAVLLGLMLPITPVQILWVNMVSSVTLALTLAFEPTEPDTMRRPPRRADEALLSPFLVWRIVFVSALFAAGTFGMFFWARARGLDVETARTIAVNTLVVMEIFYLFSVRYAHTTSVTLAGVLGTPAVLIGISATAAAQLAFTYLPVMNTLFATRPVSVADGALVLGVGIAVLIVLELEKLVRRRFVQ